MTVKTLTVETKEAREIHIDGIQQAIGKKLRVIYCSSDLKMSVLALFR